MWIKIFEEKKVEGAPGGTICQSWWNQKEGTLHRGGANEKKHAKQFLEG